MTLTTYSPTAALRRAATAALLLLAALLLTACHSDNDDYFTTAVVTIDAPEGCTISRMQGTVALTNLNSKQTTTTATFDGATAHAEVLRGSYSISVEGTVRYVDAEGKSRTASFRAATAHCEFLTHPTEVHLDIILM